MSHFEYLQHTKERLEEHGEEELPSQDSEQGAL